MKRYAAATDRNREPIADVLAEELPAVGHVLEIASGTGEHVVYFASRFPGMQWSPSDPDPAVGEEDHQLARRLLRSPALADLLRPDRADARDLPEPLRRPVEHVQDLVAEVDHHQMRGRGTDPRAR